ncbi:MAG: tRNA dihydrouridine(16) synthase DusC [Comamonadaceae bacterium]|nr:MAG: tRNA dihydrouridine(16) synthase DusC [Comamonadaceae bacterium]
MGRILLAPMEGLLDFTLRDVLTRAGGIDRCVSEFIRVTGTLLPDKVFRRIVPELATGSRTPAGVPVRAQLLGSDPACLADNAASLAALNPEGIDLNFGCPAKTVNRHRGGAILLDEPALVHEIVAAVRRAVPAHIPVSAKMRLGYNDSHYAVECAQGIEAAGACELVVHARTKADGYKAPAYWEHIPAIRESVRINVVANGEIWTVDDARRCREVTGCSDIMIGRGAVSDPGLAMAIALSGRANASGRNLTWEELQPLIASFWTLIDTHLDVRHRAGRLKQWLNYLRRTYPEAQELYARVRTINEPAELARIVVNANAANDGERAFLPVAASF